MQDLAKTLQGSLAGLSKRAWLSALLERGWVDVSDAISEVVPLERGPEMFERLHRLEPGLNKVILQPNPGEGSA